MTPHVRQEVNSWFRSVILLGTVLPIVLEASMLVLLLLKVGGLGRDMKSVGRRSIVHVMQRDGASNSTPFEN